MPCSVQAGRTDEATLRRDVAARPELAQQFGGPGTPLPRPWTALTQILTHVRERTGLDDPATRAMLGTRSPREVAAAAVAGTGLHEAEARTSLMKAGRAGIEASADPLVILARAVDPFDRKRACGSRTRWTQSSPQCGTCRPSGLCDARGVRVPRRHLLAPGDL